MNRQRRIVESAKREAQEKATLREETEAAAEGYICDEDEPEVQYLGVSQAGAIQHSALQMMQLPEDMYLAEIPRNSIQSYVANNIGGPVVWFYEKAEEEESGEPRYHPGFYDLAGGMTRQEILNFLGLLRNSGGNAEGKHGIGARLSACRASPDGVEWWSLKNGQVNGFKLWFNTELKTKPFAYKVYHDYELSVLHPEIRKAGHGTQVVFTGVEPVPANKMPAERTARWLSARWYDRPDNITLHVQRTDGALATVPTQKQALEALSEFSVDVTLSDAFIKVYILKTNYTEIPAGQRYYYADLYRTKDGKGAGGVRPRPKFFIVCDGEIYTSVKTGIHNRLRRFGITHGHHRVVMVVFPSKKDYVPNDLRTSLVPLNKKSISEAELPIDRWAKEFQDNIPPELAAYVEAAAIGTQEQNMEVINTIITEHAQHLEGKNGNGVLCGEGDVKGTSCPPDVLNQKKKKKKKKKKKAKRNNDKIVKGCKATKNRFSAPRVVWVEPEPGDELYLESGIYLPNADGGRGELHLNRCWRPLKKWQEKISHHEMMAHCTPNMIEHYSEQAMALIHVDAVMRSRIGKLPDPSADDFKGAMLLPTCRDMALREVIKVSGKVIGN